MATHSSMGFPCGSAGKESDCNARDLGLIPGLGRFLEKGKSTHSSILAWRIPWGRKELDATEQLSLSPALQVDSLLTELSGKPIGSDQNHSQEEMQKSKMVV